MVSVSKGVKPSVLDSENCLKRIRLNIKNQAFVGTYYKHKGVLQALEGIYHAKCGYCESNIRPVATPQVDHFRPKSKVKEAPDHPGYYWLGHEWSNLILACPACNNAKSSHFPVNGHRVTVPPLRSDGKLDADRCLPERSPLRDEEPELIHPEIEDTTNHFRFSPDGSIEGGTQRGTVTIETCKLNRRSLDYYRKSLIDNDLAQANLLYASYVEGLIIREQLSSLLELWLNRIVNKSKPQMEYSLFRYHALNHFDEFYINQLPTESQRSEMQKVYEAVFGD